MLGNGLSIWLPSRITPFGCQRGLRRRPARRSGDKDRPDPPAGRRAGNPGSVVHRGSASRRRGTRRPCASATHCSGLAAAPLGPSGELSKRPGGRHRSSSDAGPWGGRCCRRPSRSPELSLRHRYVTGEDGRAGRRCPRFAGQSWLWFLLESGALPPNPRSLQGMGGSSGCPGGGQGGPRASLDGQPSQPHPGIPRRVTLPCRPLVFRRTFVRVPHDVAPIQCIAVSPRQTAMLAASPLPSGRAASAAGAPGGPVA